MIIAKPTQHHYLLLVRLPAPALIQQRCCSFRQGKPLRQLLITALRRLPEEKEMVEQFSQLFGDPGNRMKSPYAIEREKDRMSHQIALKRASDVVWPCCCYLETLELVSQCEQECDLNAQTIWLAIKSMKWYQKKLKRHSSIIKLLPNVTMIEKRKNFYFIWLFLHAGLNFLCLPVSRVFFTFCDATGLVTR
jgi:hypothetical protein